MCHRRRAGSPNARSWSTWSGTCESDSCAGGRALARERSLRRAGRDADADHVGPHAADVVQGGVVGAEAGDDGGAVTVRVEQVEVAAPEREGEGGGRAERHV